MSNPPSDKLRSEIEQKATPDQVNDVGKLVDAGTSAVEQVNEIADNPKENNPITRADDIETEVEHLRRISHFLDSRLRIPGTSYRFGADSLSGLIPGIGDFLSAVFSIYIVYKAYLLGLSTGTVLRMGVNIIIDTAVGVFPVLGDLFDIGWKANNRNVKLLEKHSTGLASGERDKWMALTIVATPLLLIVIFILISLLTLFTMI